MKAVEAAPVKPLAQPMQEELVEHGVVLVVVVAPVRTMVALELEELEELAAV